MMSLYNAAKKCIKSINILIIYLTYFLSIKRGYSYFDVIRDIHRIEKGLNMNPRRSQFGLTYIYDLVSNIKTLDSHDRIWAESVISEYFNVTSSRNKNYIKAQELFNNLSIIETYTSCYATPSLGEFRYGSESLEQLLKRRSVRNYSAKRIEEKKIREYIEIAKNITPSACNRGTARASLFLGPEKSQEIASFANGTMGWLSEVQNVVVVHADYSDFSEKRDFKLPLIDGSFFLINMVNVLTLMGVSSCIVNWPEMPEKNIELKRRLAIKRSSVVLGMIVFGYAAQDAHSPSSSKRSLKRMLNEI